MAWWRRDPSLWSRSPINRYTRRILRSDSSLLRCRAFSKSPSNPAQHKDDDDAKRPPGLSNLEWMQLQHYRRWRRRLQENPYLALFGASNDMLSGKGLKDWQWIYKAFPKWMIKDMDIPGLEKKDGKGKVGEKNGKWKSEGRVGTTSANMMNQVRMWHTLLHLLLNRLRPRRIRKQSTSITKDCRSHENRHSKNLHSDHPDSSGLNTVLAWYLHPIQEDHASK